MARGREPPAGDPAYPARRERAQRGPALITLQQLRDGGCWWWLICRNPKCGHMRPIAIVPLIIRWSPQEEVERLRLWARCERCGHRGASLSMRSWCDGNIGYATWPRRFASPVEPERRRPVQLPSNQGGRT
jgi:hypothetical protein